MAITYVQGFATANDAGGTGQISGAGSAVGNGNGVVGAAGWSGAGNGPITVADNQGNTYTVVDQGLNIVDEYIAMFYRFNITNGPTTITVTYNGSNVNWRMLVWDEFTELSALDFVDGQTEAAPGTSTNGLNSTGQSTAEANELIYTVASNAWDGSRPNAGTGFTARSGFSDADGLSIDSASKIQASIASAEGLWTATSNVQHLVMVMAVKGTGGGGGSTAKENTGLHHIECGSPMGKKTNGILHPIRHGIIGWRKGLILPKREIIKPRKAA